MDTDRPMKPGERVISRAVMQRQDEMKEMTEPTTNRNKWLVNGLFISNWLLIVFLRKQFFSPPHGAATFVVKNVVTFALAVLVTSLMYRNLPKKAVVIAIPEILVLAVLTAIF
jgi:hypothetical protein